MTTKMKVETSSIVENGKTYEVKTWANGTKRWFLNDLLHREEGPAVEYPSGRKEWHLKGKRQKYTAAIDLPKEKKAV